MDWLIDPMDMDELDTPLAGDAAMMGATYDETWGAAAAAATGQQHDHAAGTTSALGSAVSYSFPAQTTLNTAMALHAPPTHTPASSLPTSAFLGAGLGAFSAHYPGLAGRGEPASPPLRAIGLEEMDASVDSLDTSLSAVSGSVSIAAPRAGASRTTTGAAAGAPSELLPFSLGSTSVSPALQAISLRTPHNRGRRLSALSASGSVTGSLAALTGLAAPKHVEAEAEAEGEDDAEGDDAERPNKRARADGEGSSSPAPSSSARSVSASISAAVGSSPASATKKKTAKGKAAHGPSITTTPAIAATALPALGASNTTTNTAAAPPPPTGDLLAPPPQPKRPWNTSPQSTHLPSGSQLINPLTNELDLKPELLEGLTKEEIRKVKNRASAQRSRTRKWEVQEGLKGENERLREELERLRAEMEGNEDDDDAPEERERERAARPPQRDEEKEAMKTLIERLRREVAEEKAARAKAEAEVWSLKAQLDAAIKSATTIAGMAAHARGQSGIPSPATSAEDEIVSIGDSVGDAHSSAAERGEMKHGRDKAMVTHGGRVKAAGKDGKGVLMMVVLFSFALFTIPPHLRGNSYPTYLPVNSNSLPLTEPSRPVLGRVLSFEDGDAVMRNQSTMVDSTVMVTTEEDADTGDACIRAVDEDKNEDGLCPNAAPTRQALQAIKRRGAARGRKSFSFTLLRPINEDQEMDAPSASAQIADALSEQSEDQAGEVENVLQRWLGLSLFDEAKAEGNTTVDGDHPSGPAIPGGWIVVDSSAPEPASSSRQPQRKSESPSDTVPKAWDGSELEMMNLDTEMLSISGASEQTTLFPPPADKRVGPSPTLAPQMLEDPLAEEVPASPPMYHLPGSFPQSASTPSRRLDTLPSSALMALSNNQAEKFMKLELEVDIEVEVSCTGVRRKGQGRDRERRPADTGLSVVSRDEVGRILSLGTASAGLESRGNEERGLALRGMVADMGGPGAASGWQMI